MQSFAEFIAESFYSEVVLNWKVKSTTHALASFTIRSVSIEVSFEQRETKGPWHVAFNVLKGDAAETATLAFRIFNGVFQAVGEFIETRQPDVVVFISKDDDLANIYQTYLRREKNRIEELGYRLEGPHRVEPYTEFTLRRVTPTDWKD
jgi:hypothetical protein